MEDFHTHVPVFYPTKSIGLLWEAMFKAVVVLHLVFFWLVLPITTALVATMAVFLVWAPFFTKLYWLRVLFAAGVFLFIGLS